MSAGGSAGEGGEEGQEAGDAGGQAGGEERREHARAARLHGAGWAEQCPSGCRGAIWQPGGDAADAKPVPACSSGSGAWRLLSMLGLCVLHALVMYWAGWDVLCSLITVYT